MLRGLKTTICLLLVLCFAGLLMGARAEQRKGLHPFFLHYVIVSYLKDGGREGWRRLEEFAHASPIAAKSLAEFWWRWGLRDCHEFLNEQIMRGSKTSSKEERAMEIENINKERNYCIQSFMFDRWDNINESIRNKFAQFPSDN